MNLSISSSDLERISALANKGSAFNSVQSEIAAVCTKHGFQSYEDYQKQLADFNDFVAQLNRLEEKKQPKQDSATPTKPRKARTTVTQNIVEKVKAMTNDKKTVAEIAKEVGLSKGSVMNIQKPGYIFSPKPKGRKKGKKGESSAATGNESASAASSSPANPAG
jgi:hypothetical protein